MVTRQIQSGDAQLYVEAIGEARNPCVILVMGAQASLTWWPGEFCETLAARGRYVLRFDNRDTGLSTKYPVGAPGYSLDDMADDVIAILDGFGVAKAQLVGVSMGGMIGQIAGLKYPARFTQLAIVSSTPLDGAQRHLPGPTKAFMAATARGEKVDWNNREQATKALLQFGRVLAADEKHFDESGARAVIEADFDRSGGLAHSTNHFQVKGGESWSAHLAGLQPPLVVLHGRLPRQSGERRHFRGAARRARSRSSGLGALDRRADQPPLKAFLSFAMSNLI